MPYKKSTSKGTKGMQKRERNKKITLITLKRKVTFFYFVCLQHSSNERMNERTHMPARPYRFIRYTLFNHLSTNVGNNPA